MEKLAEQAAIVVVYLVIIIIENHRVKSFVRVQWLHQQQRGDDVFEESL